GWRAQGEAGNRDLHLMGRARRPFPARSQVVSVRGLDLGEKVQVAALAVGERAREKADGLCRGLGGVRVGDSQHGQDLEEKVEAVLTTYPRGMPQRGQQRRREPVVGEL